MARPWTAVIGVRAVLLFLAIPVLSLDTGTEALAQFPKDSDVRVGNELASDQLGGGTDPVQIVASFEARPAPRDARRSPASSARSKARPASAAVAPPVFAGDGVLIQATPSAPSESDAATALVDRLRDTVVPAAALAKSRHSRRRRRDRPQRRRPRTRSAARCGRSSSSSSRSASSS